MFHLAERLGMTVGELGTRMTAAEYMLWMSHDSLTTAEAQHQQALKG